MKTFQEQRALGLFLRRRMDSAGVSIEELAERADISERTIMNWRHGQGIGQVVRFLSLFDHLGVDVKFIDRRRQEDDG